jgi:hypothetical protein
MDQMANVRRMVCFLSSIALNDSESARANRKDELCVKQ